MKVNTATLFLFGILAAPLHAQTVVVFGDSLSDIGQGDHPTENLKASYTSKGVLNPLWDEILARQLGTGLTPSSRGGTDYAYSGGLVNKAYLGDPTKLKQEDMQWQVNQYIASAKLDPSALHVLWGGGNDLSAIVSMAAKNPGIAETLIRTQTANTANASFLQLKTLQAAGIQEVILPNVPNVTLTPALFSGLFSAVGANFAQIPTVGTALQQQWMSAYAKANAAYHLSTQTSGEDFDTARHQIITATVKTFRQSSINGTPIAAIMDRIGQSEESLTRALLTSYAGLTQMGNGATTLLNSATNNAAQNSGSNVIRPDIDKLFGEIVSSPAIYGFDNTVSSACSAITAAVPCTYDGKTRYLFADPFHPSPAAHALMADYLLSILRAPQQVSLLRTAQENSHSAADTFLQNNLQAARVQGVHAAPGVEAIAAYTRNGEDYRGNDAHAGIRVYFTPQLQSGVLYTRSQNRTVTDGISFKNHTDNLSAFIRYDHEYFWLGGFARVGNAGYTILRQVKLGPAQINQTAQTGGTEYAAGIDGGYEWQKGAWRFGPVADLSYLNGKIAGFSEQGNLGLAFGKQKYATMRLGLGGQASASFGSWQPFTRIRWVHNLRHGDDTITTYSSGLPFTTAVAKADRTYLESTLGVNWIIHPGWHAFTAVNKNFAEKDNHRFSFNIGLGASF